MSQRTTRPITHTLLCKTTLLWLGIGLLFTTGHVFSAPSADKVKAAYIYQLTQFVTWPDDAFTNNTLRICVLGKEAIADELAPLHQQQKGKLLINVLNPKALKHVSACQILYIAKNNSQQLQNILHHLRNDLHKKPILTVSSIPGFTANGGIIGFVIIDNKVRLEINRTSAQQAGIKLNAKLLEVASVVRNDDHKEGQP